MAKNVEYVINLRDKFSKKLSKVQKRSNSFGKSMGSLKGKLIAALSGYAVMRAFKTLLDAFDKQAVAVGQVEQGLISTGRTVGFTLEQLTKQAIRFQRNTIFGDETILQGVTAQLLTFTNITGTAFYRTQKAVMDVTSRLYGAQANAESLRGTSIMLGKALNDPVANLGALSRAGIQFSDSQKEVIKKFAQTNQIAKAQEIILNELANQYGGSAAAIAKAGMGTAKQTKAAWGDIKETLGKGVADMVGGSGAITTSLLATNRMMIEQGGLLKSVGKNWKTFGATTKRYLQYEILSKAVDNFTDRYVIANKKQRDALKKTFLLELKRTYLEAKKTGKKDDIVKYYTLKKLYFEALKETLVFDKESAEAVTKGFNMASATIRELKKHMNDLTEAQQDTILGSKEYLGYQKEIERTQRKLGKKGVIEGVTKRIEAGIGAGLKGVTAGAPKTFNINIEKLVGIEEFITNNVKQGINQMGEEIKKQLLIALRDTQIIAG